MRAKAAEFEEMSKAREVETSTLEKLEDGEKEESRPLGWRI